MVAYSFQRQFVGPILAGTKRQTIRGERRRHARPGEEMQLYTGMRTRSCKLIQRVTCERVVPVRLCFSAHDAAELYEVGGVMLLPASMEIFARDDGFGSVAEMAAFWTKHHPGIEEFQGVLIGWAAA